MSSITCTHSLSILSIDIGVINPGITLLSFDEKTKIIKKIFLLSNFNLKGNLHKIISQNNLDLVIIERQHIGKNKDFMHYLVGYFESRFIKTIIVNPISKYKFKNINVNRKIKKMYSVDLANKILKTDFKYKDSDICDSFNIAYNYLLEKYKEITQIDNIKIFDTFKLQDCNK